LISRQLSIHLSFSTIICFSQLSAAPPHLPSFPTRRSSDLSCDRGREPVDHQARQRTDQQQRGDDAETEYDDEGALARFRDDHRGDRKSTRLNSSHVAISYAVFCLKKKKKKE